MNNFKLIEMSLIYGIHFISIEKNSLNIIFFFEQKRLHKIEIIWCSRKLKIGHRNGFFRFFQKKSFQFQAILYSIEVGVKMGENTMKNETN